VEPVAESVMTMERDSNGVVRDPIEELVESSAFRKQLQQQVS
jgi:hypothetical protein